jgi:hypothetical protein
MNVPSSSNRNKPTGAFFAVESETTSSSLWSVFGNDVFSVSLRICKFASSSSCIFFIFNVISFAPVVFASWILLVFIRA